MKHDLLLTLGHNSSAILVSDGEIVCGYEEERLTKVKSDSRFPIEAIRQCLGPDTDSPEIDGIFVTHWSPDGMLTSMSKRHWDPSKLPDHKRFVTHSQDFTHHDAHAHSAAWYAFAQDGLKRENSMIFVIDGFGNYGEHISVYSISGYGPKLIRRFYGYGGSMGLMYQYMTAFMGMKMHEDEYKILGYEVGIERADVDLQLLHKKINTEITRYLDSYFDNKKLVGEFDALIRLDALPALQKHYIDKWTALCKELALSPEPCHETRVVLSYYIQAILEGVILTLIKIYKPTNLIGAGGVFYNVKLNRRILDFIPGKLCVFPLAGDQGGALGLYCTGNELYWPGNFNWGRRPRPPGFQRSNIPGFVYLQMQDPADWALPELKKNGCVNIVRGRMEFGPRALCNTSTIALPQPSIVNRINQMNGRNTVMPMAPVMNRSEYHSRMKLTGRVHMSEEHMIVALPYKEGRESDVLGAAHQYLHEYTGRPQVLDGDPLMDRLLSEHPVLINTSFNYHGRPIVLGYDDAVYTHHKQQEVFPITTIYLEDRE